MLDSNTDQLDIQHLQIYKSTPSLHNTRRPLQSAQRYLPVARCEHFTITLYQLQYLSEATTLLETTDLFKISQIFQIFVVDLK